MDKVLNYFSGDAMAADAWRDKYQMKDPDRPNEVIEETPDDMHMRLAYEFGEIEYQYSQTEIQSNPSKLSEFGQKLIQKRVFQTKDQMVLELFHYFKGFGSIVPQGSIMSNLGNHYVFGSLSNCFGIAPPLDSYGGILHADQHLAQLMKRRGGVGTHLNNIRPTLAGVTNASKSSTGVPTYAERYSNTTREVAQEGRRGALMLLLSVKHPDIFRFVTMKDDRSKVTGANVSVMFTDRFMKCVEEDKDFLCTFPVDLPFELKVKDFKDYPYNALHKMKGGGVVDFYIMRIRARELFETFVHMAWSNAEPGAAYIDRIIGYSPDGVYEAYMPELCNPCGEQWFHRNDTCRLIALFLMGVIKNPFTDKAEIDWDRLYEISYMQQRIGDDLVDLEAIYIDRIIDKIKRDPEPMYIKQAELNLWKDIKELALAGRRTGNGFTALGDMLAALLKPYVSLDIIEEVMKCKMRAELDCTIDMAVTRGTFKGWDAELEFGYNNGILGGFGKNKFFEMMTIEFPEQTQRMVKYGRRNVSWSTVAPTGTVSVMCQSTSGIEPLFKAFYIRKKKINANEVGVRVDEVDGMGDSWQYYSILHPQFKEWIKVNSVKLLATDVVDFDVLDKGMLEYLFKLSPWYGSEADDISWEDRIKVNAIVQKYTTNSISCTVNLPENIAEEVVHNIYFEGWKAGLKGITVYRDKCRTGVLVSEVKQISIDEHGFTDATPRPESLDADYFFVKSNGKEFAVIVGKLNSNPYELFAFESPSKKENAKGKLIKIKSGEYRFEANDYTINNVQLANLPDERMICRFVSGMLRHRMNPKYIADQVDKSEISVVSFGKAVQRVLKAYVPDEEINGEACPNCGEHTVIYQEGCKRCISCGHSKC